MPGSSLWLLPPKSHPLNDTLVTLIEQTSSRFGSLNRFIPHITITSEISPSLYAKSPQKWLDSLQLPEGNHVKVKFERLASEDVYVRKLYIKCTKTKELEELAGICRQQVEGQDEEKAITWATDTYNPHLSLLYHDCPPVDANALAATAESVEKAGLKLAGEGDFAGWVGGRIILVPTDKSIEEWAPIAEKTF
ncbi:2',3'-cyclic-nucleotide 3'-phosphodiesterase [Phaeosphaeria sp. MPI-PUGE-AT-0046c]|nr:2',3'-cyclic-nucleotide 3'-phosphodiesterase [Phaeosphaeria sp. MPI-PUGE-AT-0046c]